MVKMSWEDAETAITENREDLNHLLTQLRDYEYMKQNVTKLIKNAEDLTIGLEAPRHFNMEEVQHHLTKLEVCDLFLHQHRHHTSKEVNIFQNLGILKILR